MGINDEYSRDAYYEQTWDSDDPDEFDVEIHPEDWQDLHSAELLDGWSYLREFVHDNYLTLRSSCTFPTFVNLVVDANRWIGCDPNQLSHRAWTYIQRVKIIKDRVPPENFYRWFNENISYI